VKIYWTEEGLKRLDEIESYISRDNPGVAREFINKILDKVEILMNQPDIGRVVPELSIEKIREIIYKNYRIVYLVKAEHIEILTVFEGHKQLNREEIKTN